MHLDVQGARRRDGAAPPAGETVPMVDGPTVGDVAHALLRFGRLKLVSGAATEYVQESVVTLAGRLGYQANLLVGAEGLLLTVQDQHGFHTKLGPAISDLTVNTGALAALDGIVRQALSGPTDLAQLNRQLDAVEHDKNSYPRWLVALGMGLTAASLARLYGATWPVVGAAALVGVISVELRERLAARSMNAIACAATVAFITGLIGALAVKTVTDASPALCLAAAGVILLPGVLLINGVRDMLGRHVGTGIARLALGVVTIASIAFGLLLAASLMGENLTVTGNTSRLPIGEDLLFSALVGVGPALAFNIPARAAWACLVCAALGHGLRSMLMHVGMTLAMGSLVSAFSAVLLGRVFARQFGVPPATFAFPGVVTLMPGSYALWAAAGGLDIMHAGAAASPALIGQTIGLGVTTILVTASIAVGLSLALAAPFGTSSPYADATRSPRG